MGQQAALRPHNRVRGSRSAAMYVEAAPRQCMWEPLRGNVLPCDIKFVDFCFTSVVGQGLVLRPRGPQIRFLDLKLRLETMCTFFTEDLMVVSSGHPCTTVVSGLCLW